MVRQIPFTLRTFFTQITAIFLKFDFGLNQLRSISRIHSQQVFSNIHLCLLCCSSKFVVGCLGKPPRPSPSLEPGKDNINFLSKILNGSQTEINFPVTPEQLGIRKEKAIEANPRKGGEKVALILLQKRLDIEKSAFEKGCMLPNHSNPDLFLGASLSPYLRFGMKATCSFYTVASLIVPCISIIILHCHTSSRTLKS